MARNSENAPSEPSGRRRKLPEGGSHLRQHFRDSIRDALSGVDVDALQGRTSLPVPTDVSLLTREAVTDLEAELAALRAERAALERRAAERASAAAAVVDAPPVAEPRGEPAEPPRPEPAAPQRGGRRPWGRGRPARLEVDDGGTATSGEEPGPTTVPWSLARAMEPVAESRSRRDPAPKAAATVAAEPPPAATAAPAVPGPQAAPAPAEPPSVPAPRRRSSAARRQAVTDTELESVVAPLLAELANLRAEVRELRGDPDAAIPARQSNRQLVKLVAGILLGFALIVVALAVVLKA
jgi:hypothetical protein